VIHPVAIRYMFEGNLGITVEPMLAAIEERLGWRTRGDLPLRERVVRIGGALLALKEIEHGGTPQPGGIDERVRRLIDHLLGPIEDAWLKRRQDGDVVARVKRLRTALLPDLVAGQLSEGEAEQRWTLLAQLYLAQQLACYPGNYLNGNPPPERILETVERFEEDLTDKVRQVSPLRALLDVGDAIEVAPERVRGGEDPVMTAIHEQLESMLRASLAERRPGAIWP